jgi:ABC-type sugar transport system ATPase subunit
MTDEIIAARAEHVTKLYGSGDAEVTALAGVTVGIPRGRFTAIMGPSGSGKSTLMHCMAGLDSVSGGRVFIGDVELSKLDDKRLTRLRRDKVGFVFQTFNLVPTLTALENITLPMDIAGRKPDLALSVIERTREIGLLRAVGMQRGQVRRMIRYEAMVISVFGGLLGLGSGAIFGVVFQNVMAGNGMEVLAIPFDRLAGYGLAAAFIGVITAIWPARRAAKTDILRAIATE